MGISEQEWNQIEMELRGVHGEVILDFEGTKVTLNKGLIAENQLAIAVYLNDQIKPVFGMPDMTDHFKPITELLWRKRSRSTYPPSRRKRILKTFNKTELKGRGIDLDRKQVWYEAFYSKFNPLKQQYQKLENLKVVSIGYRAKTA